MREGGLHGKDFNVVAWVEHDRQAKSDSHQETLQSYNSENRREFIDYAFQAL
jgi:hypothetical protein